ncbi:MAG: Signal-peptide peptidase presenilin aspartyl protease, partial [Thermoplasmata archaeon]|nr:Signal-peptide peptidase presenilin aspartyl protease [Thermoplasmata archaeon]
MPVEPTPLTVPDPPLMPVTMAEYRGTAVLLAFFVATMMLAVLFAAPFKTAGLQAFSDPQDVGNSIWYIAL